MNTISYEVWVAPENGPLTVQERGKNNEISFQSKGVAIEVATLKKVYYPNLDFVVIEKKSGWASSSETSKIVFKTNCLTKNQNKE